MKILQRLMLAILLVGALGVVGCGESKPDPRERDDFVDTSDPSNLSMPSGKSGNPKGDQPQP